MHKKMFNSILPVNVLAKLLKPTTLVGTGTVGASAASTETASIGMLAPATKEPNINDIFTLNTLQINKTRIIHKSIIVSSKFL